MEAEILFLRIRLERSEGNSLKKDCSGQQETASKKTLRLCNSATLQLLLLLHTKNNHYVCRKKRLQKDNNQVAD
jgi:hypothetical protein